MVNKVEELAISSHLNVANISSKDIKIFNDYILIGVRLSVDVKDFKALADQVLQLLDQPNRAMEIRKNAAAWALTHPIHWTVVEIKKLYINVV